MQTLMTVLCIPKMSGEMNASGINLDSRVQISSAVEFYLTVAVVNAQSVKA